MENYYDMSEEEFQKTRKSLLGKFKIAFFISLGVLAFGILLSILGFSLKTTGTGPFAEEVYQVPALKIIGPALIGLGIFASIITGVLTLQIKFTTSRKVQSFMMQNASPMANTMAEKTKPAVTTVASGIAEGLQNTKQSKKDQLNEIEELLQNKDITQEEYEIMRKKILGL